MNTIIMRIESQVASLQKKIDALSGSYLTNTRKRQEEQKWRDTQKERLSIQKQVLEYLAEEAGCREMTALESALITGTFYESMRVLAAQKAHAKEHPNTRNAYTYLPQGEVADKKLNKAGIFNAEDMLSAISSYEDLVHKAAIPQDPRVIKIRDLTFKARMLQEGDVQFTPVPLVAQLIELVGVTEESRVLEPEAGIGGIADEVRKITPYVDCIEPVPIFRELLELKGHNLIGSDLFECELQPEYDAVIMNPPFSDECRHIRYAYDFVKPGGTLVAICSVGVQHISYKKYQEFRDWLSLQLFQTYPVTEKFEMTGVNTLILVIEKPASVD